MILLRSWNHKRNLNILIEDDFLYESDDIIAHYKVNEEADPDAEAAAVNYLVQTVHTHEEPSEWNAHGPKDTKCADEKVHWPVVKEFHLLLQDGGVIRHR